MSYPGGKHGPGVFQRLINEIPPHDVYIAGCAGHDAIAQNKRPAVRNILIDLDPEPLAWWSEYLAAMPDVASSFELHRFDVVDWLTVRFGLSRIDGYQDAGTGDHGRTFVYLDPPYLMDTRSSGPLYRHEMTDDDHRRLLGVITRLPCMVMICGYHSDLYGGALSRWRHFTYQSVCRSGAKRTEHAWCNYPAPETLHDSRYVGNDKRQRENIRRRTRRLVANLNALSSHERQAVIDGLGTFSSR
jgi:DNA adenine methylase